jgi:ketosteroid isomerase-like protein
MRALAGVLCLALMLAGGVAIAASPGDDAMATIHTFIDAFNKGDIKTAAATHEPDAAIIDEMPPHQWHGPGAFQAWVGALMKSAADAGQTDQQAVLGRTIRVQVDGDTAYVVMEATFTYEEHGKPVAEPAQIVCSLRQDAGTWKISAWAWSGAVPHPG